MINSSLTGRVGVIELDRPERRNALDVEHCAGLGAAVAGVLDEGARAIVVTGAGTAFCAGADLDQVHDDGFRDALHAALRAIAEAPVPVVAAVNGPAIGAGTQLAVACDLRVADPRAVFAVPTARLGLAVDPWTVRRLAQLAGGGTARSLLLACDRVDAVLAHARGLVDRIGPTADALALAEELAGLAPLTLRYNKLTLDGIDGPADDPAVVAAYRACWSSADGLEGPRAAAERRPAAFTGR
ncbi:enoyl-CoA hydratase [Pseudonocardia humida]|uniref:Enoyl-CoA hydratase n=1 Tax=Pseudonocardia humida TaxID=2800819 RepID=A0ABT0ZZN0_9PSEU|nr:enoyl-CoA hydratase [Pseudonocardia humida]MCO1656029.1 enoyl-CoA hydratase [Pseudonocardia humida]